MPNHETRIRRNQPELTDDGIRKAKALWDVQPLTACPRCGGTSMRGELCPDCYASDRAALSYGFGV